MFNFVREPKRQSIDEERGIVVSGGDFGPPPYHLGFTYADKDIEFVFEISHPEPTSPLSQLESEEWGLSSAAFEFIRKDSVRRASTSQRVVPTPDEWARVKRNIIDALAVWMRPAEMLPRQRIVRFVAD